MYSNAAFIGELTVCYIDVHLSEFGRILCLSVEFSTRESLEKKLAKRNKTGRKKRNRESVLPTVFKKKISNL